MKKGIWTADWLVALVICLVFGVAAWSQNETLEGLERAAYDLGVRGSTRDASDRLAVIAIDEQSIDNLGRWPWPRNIHATMIETLRAGGARVVGDLVFFSEPQIDPGLDYIDRLAETYRASGLSIPALERQFAEARQTLDTDALLAASVERASNVVLPMTFVLGEPLGNPDRPLPPYVTRNALGNVSDRLGLGRDGVLPPPALGAETPPIPEIGEQALAIGHLNQIWDVDGAARREALVIRYFNEYYPSFALQVAARSLNLTDDDVEVRLGEGVRLGRLEIGTDPYLLMNTFFYADRDGIPAFPVDSFYDVYSGRIPAEKYRDKVVLIGASAAGVGTLSKTPVSAAMAPVVTLAHTVSSILNEDFFVTPPWGVFAELGVFLLVCLYLVLLLPRLRAGIATAVSLVVLLAILITQYVLMTGQATWLELATPAALLVVGHVLLTTKRYLVTERGKMVSDAESAESNRMLGLAFQGQGQLDMAFEKFRKCPLDDSIMDLLYNLALDYERKRQFNKAGAVYRYMSGHDAKFRDIAARISRSQAMEDTVLLGAAGGGKLQTLIVEGEGVQKPMLGRYQVEKELGKGAMGIVYLGRDPKINRVVAIKTMALSQEFDEDEVDEVKERFFREAETAGRLNHPNIVTIFDAGEEHDLAYIAMEFLKGQDLTKYTKADRLLPVNKVLKAIIQSAEALDYAHSQNVVHRDIKPANIMYEADSGNVKLTDFGIARITDSSRTKTGMVLGTPSYMSPEQLAGRKVDGRSDLFSLGVTLYQLCTGQLPFRAESMATLMYKIANEEHPDPLSIRPDLPPCLKAIITKSLTKAVNERYSRGAEMARDLRACAAFAAR